MAHRQDENPLDGHGRRPYDGGHSRTHSGNWEQGQPPRQQEHETWSDFLRATRDATAQETAQSVSASRKRQRSGASNRIAPPSTPPHRHGSSSGSRSNPVDLVTPPPRHRTTSSTSIRLPRWQPDEEASACSACSTPFTILNRKHHCRKCGKIVCGACSQHRITMPKQFIVQSPANAGSSTATDRPFLLGGYLSSPGSGSTDLAGRETVRVCNPCVPDPNYDPPPQDGPPHANWTDDVASWVRQTPSHGGPPPSYRHATQPYPHSSYRPRASTTISPLQRHHSSTTGPAPPSSRRPIPQFENAEHGPGFGRSAPLLSQAVSHGGVRHFRVNEEDLCPVCGKLFPPLDSGRSTPEARESHIRRCIERSEARTNAATSNEEHEHGNHHNQRQTEPISGSPASAHSRFVQNVGELLSGRRRTLEPERPPPRPEPQMPLRDMLRFEATAVDVANNEEKGGPPEECIICLEEFEVGQELGRLDCFCKFHARCLGDWWHRKGSRECPTHKMFGTSVS